MGTGGKKTVLPEPVCLGCREQPNDHLARTVRNQMNSWLGSPFLQEVVFSQPSQGRSDDRTR